MNNSKQEHIEYVLNTVFNDSNTYTEEELDAIMERNFKLCSSAFRAVLNKARKENNQVQADFDYDNFHICIMQDCHNHNSKFTFNVTTK